MTTGDDVLIQFSVFDAGAPDSPVSLEHDMEDLRAHLSAVDPMLTVQPKELPPTPNTMDGGSVTWAVAMIQAAPTIVGAVLVAMGPWITAKYQTTRTCKLRIKIGDKEIEIEVPVQSAEQVKATLTTAADQLKTFPVTADKPATKAKKS